MKHIFLISLSLFCFCQYSFGDEVNGQFNEMVTKYVSGTGSQLACEKIAMKLAMFVDFKNFPQRKSLYNNKKLDVWADESIQVGIKNPNFVVYEISTEPKNSQGQNVYEVGFWFKKSGSKVKCVLDGVLTKYIE